MHVRRNHGQLHPKPIDAISGDLYINGCKKVSFYYGFIQRTGHPILLADGSKSASIDFEIASVLEHRWIQRRVTSIEGFRGSGSNHSWVWSILSDGKFMRN